MIQTGEKHTERRLIIILTMMIAAVILLFKIAQLQILNRSFAERAKNTTIQKERLYPSRGIIYDRNGKLLVTNDLSYNLEVIYNELDPSMDTTKFCSLLNIDKEAFLQNINKDFRNIKYSKSIPYTFLKRISPKDFAVFQEHLFEFPGFYPKLRNIRTYPYPNGANVLGFLGEVNEKQIEASEGKYSLGDYVGATGLERQYEEDLHGLNGTKYVLKDNLGREINEIELKDNGILAKEGVDIQTSLDIELQAYGEYLMQGKKGSIVAIEPATGEILATISTPTYDPNDLRIGRDRGKIYKELLMDTLSKPLFDRSALAEYPPGSIFKPILALIALQEGILKPSRYIACDGSYEINSKGQSQGCHDHPPCRNVSAAIQYSCNSYFYQTIKEFIEMEGFRKPNVGIDKLKAYLTEFGVGTSLEADIPSERKGNFPGSDYFDKLYGNNRWRSTAVLSLGIGQGEILLTSIQMANLAAIIANRGHYKIPHLIKEFSNGKQIDPKFNELHNVSIDKTYFEPVIDGMEKVVSQGTGTMAFVPGLDVCGKTGTSQNPFGKDHSVFFAFAPKDNPKIALSVYVENGGWGSTYGAPIAGLMIEKYLNDTINHRRQWVEDRMIQADLINVP